MKRTANEIGALMAIGQLMTGQKQEQRREDPDRIERAKRFHKNHTEARLRGDDARADYWLRRLKSTGIRITDITEDQG